MTLLSRASSAAHSKAVRKGDGHVLPPAGAASVLAPCLRERQSLLSVDGASARALADLAQLGGACHGGMKERCWRELRIRSAPSTARCDPLPRRRLSTLACFKHPNLGAVQAPRLARHGEEAADRLPDVQAAGGHSGAKNRTPSPRLLLLGRSQLEPACRQPSANPGRGRPCAQRGLSGAAGWRGRLGGPGSGGARPRAGAGPDLGAGEASPGCLGELAARSPLQHCHP